MPSSADVAQEWTPTYKWTFTAMTKDGSTADVEVGIGDRGRLDDVDEPTDLTRDLLVSCGFDAERDIAFPARLELRSTTSGFTTDFEVALSLTRDSSRDTTLLTNEGDSIVSAATEFNGSPSCDGFAVGDFRASFGVKFSSVKPAGERAQSFYIVVQDYYSPSYPDGDDSLLKALWIRPNSNADELTWRQSIFDEVFMESASGPGMILQLQLDGTTWPNSWAFSPLGDGADPSTMSDCCVPL